MNLNACLEFVMTIMAGAALRTLFPETDWWQTLTWYVQGIVVWAWIRGDWGYRSRPQTTGNTGE